MAGNEGWKGISLYFSYGCNIMKVTFEQRDEELVLHTEGRIDTYTAEDFEKGLLAGSEKADCVRLDFENSMYQARVSVRF